MANAAKVALTGKIIRDPVQKDWQGTTVVSFSVAVNTTKKEGDNYVADFYNVSIWGKSAEFIMPRISKGSMVQVYGDLILQTYKDKNGVEQKSLSVRATEVIPLTYNKNGQKKEESEIGEPPPF